MKWLVSPCSTYCDHSSSHGNLARVEVASCLTCSGISISLLDLRLWGMVEFSVFFPCVLLRTCKHCVLQSIVHKSRREFAHFLFKIEAKVCACADSRRNFWTTNWKSTVRYSRMHSDNYWACSVPLIILVINNVKGVSAGRGHATPHMPVQRAKCWWLLKIEPNAWAGGCQRQLCSLR